MLDTLNQHNSGRSILLALGMGDYNATMVIPYLFMAPAQTDPQMAQIILLTEHLQKAMVRMGCPLRPTGSIDASWAPYMAQVCGSQWYDLPWAEIGRQVLAAAANGKRLRPQGITLTVKKSALSGILDAPFGLPAVPGGALTYGVGAFLLWRHLKKGA